MIEIIAAIARWSQLTANLILFGSCVFLVTIGHQKALFEAPWVVRLERWFPWMTGIILLGLMGILAVTTGEATGVVANVWSPFAWLEIVQNTQIGYIWVARAVLASVLLMVILYFQRVKRERWHYLLWAVAASFPLITGTLMSHSSADEMSFAAVAPYAVHILLAGAWFGALPAFLFILYSNHSESGKAVDLKTANYLKKFSVVALPVILLLAVTGLIVTDRLVETFYHTLVASPYGWLLIAKLSVLAVILVIAYQARYRWLPMLFEDGTERTRRSTKHLRQWVGIEFLLALLLVLLATILANTLPAKHAIIENWPYPFRFSINATWDEPYVQEMVWSGIALFFIALCTIWLGRKYHWSKMTKILVPGLLGISSMAIALPPLAIEAYPETYLKPTVPFDTISIVNGSRLFAENCINCHGPQGKGTQPVADPDVRDPTDLLTQQHTAQYTVGNVFHLLTHGIPGTQMPGFAATLSEDDRWDLINFLHALSRGFDARLLGSMILPEMPAIASPVFNYAANDGSGGNLRDFRLQKNVLLVLFSWPQSKERFFQLAASYDRIKALDTEVLAIPIRALEPWELEQIAEIANFPVVIEGWSEIKDSYWLYRRIRAVPDLSGKGMFPGHMEFITDRFGYLRARWVAQFEGFGWQNFDALTLQLRQLNEEDEIMPPPGEHAH
ncbi:CopD family protein [Nitrosomonas ureae]|uniref:Putative copper resistance protein D n=1 Tax=Nitrosomonas ureae TaxID=44577 RepID=A0A1H5U823_9PROT|nr:CopD family protein [Nitrosomonas ureae]SEF71255.1 putative copper resistance protein D [Nitrosomonas ureae]